MENNRPKVGLGVIVVKDNKILLGKRKNSHGDGSWGFPGGHLEYGESFEECSRRETLEETDVKIKNIKYITITNDVFEVEKKHYITIYMLAEYDSGDVKIMEPDKFDKWDWFSWEDLPEPLFMPIKNFVRDNEKPF